MEIERKFLVKKLPDNYEDYQCIRICQGYLCKHPVVRIRQWNDEYILTYKLKKQIETGDVAIQSEEVELPLNEIAFKHLATKIDNNLIYKRRYIIPLKDGLKLELDIFDGKLEGLMFAEVEFPDNDTAEAFKKPKWLGDDVSFDKRYRNSYLSTLESLEDGWV